MNKIVCIWLCGASLLWGFSMGVDEACKKEHHSVENPIAFLAWPIGAIAIASGWKSGQKDICE